MEKQTIEYWKGKKDYEVPWFRDQKLGRREVGKIIELLLHLPNFNS